MGKIKHSKEIDTNYLFLFLKLNFNKLNTKKRGGAIPHLDYRVFNGLEIPLPPLEIQKRIVARVEELFEKIDKAKELRVKALEETEEIFQSALQEIFDKAKKKWGVRKLGEISNVFAGSSAPQGEKYFENGKYPFVRVQDLARHGKTKNLVEVKYKVNNLALKDYRLVLAKRGTILFPKSGAAIFTNSRAILGIDAYIVGHLAAIDPDPFVALIDWVFYFLCQFDMSKLTKTTALPSLKLSQVKEIQLPLPPLSEQKRIVAYLDDLREKVEKLKQLRQKQLEELNELKNSVLDKDFKGELIRNNVL
jgi:type I restriction enzyme S subunit